MLGVDGLRIALKPRLDFLQEALGMQRQRLEVANLHQWDYDVSRTPPAIVRVGR